MRSFVVVLLVLGAGYISPHSYIKSEPLYAYPQHELLMPVSVQMMSRGNIKSQNEVLGLTDTDSLLLRQVAPMQSPLGTSRFIDFTLFLLLGTLAILAGFLWQTNRHQKKLSETDVLTKLPNRSGFRSEFERLLEESVRKNNRFAFGILDLDGFKLINDAHGFRVGDEILIKVAKRLQRTMGDDGLIGRMGGDEFVFLLKNIKSYEQVRDFTSRILSSLSEIMQVGEKQISQSGTIGLALYPDAGKTREDLYICADYALHHRKLNSPGKMQLFDSSHKDDYQRRRRIEIALNQANLESEIYTVYQPINCAFSGATLGFEALSRWNNEALGDISPGEFIPIAERIGRINDLTFIILRKALEHAKTWHSDVLLTINLSSHNLSSFSAAKRIKEIILNSDFPPHRIVIELTETAIVRDARATRRALHDLKEIGVRIALDDFGTGYSSLNHVTQFPIDLIKIDSSLTSELATSHKSKSIIELTINMCDQLGLKCVVEGVESEKQVKLLRLLGARYLQGYHFSKPLLGKDVNGYLSRVV